MMTSGPMNMLLSLLMAQNPMQPRTEEPPVLASRLKVVGCFQSKLQNTLYIPDYPSYIFSVNAAIQNGSSISLTPDSAVMTTPDGNKFNIIKHEKLYYLPTSSTSVIDCGN